MPRDGPPTYRGHDIKYFYKLTIATQRVKSKVQTLTVPIRVLPIPLIARPEELPITEETNDELAPTNPFLEKKDVTELEISWHHLKVVLVFISYLAKLMNVRNLHFNRMLQHGEHPNSIAFPINVDLWEDFASLNHPINWAKI